MKLARFWPLIVFIFLAPYVVSSRDVRAQSVSLSCAVSMSDIAFGSFDVLPGASVRSNGTLSISCVNITAITGSLFLCVAIPQRVMSSASRPSTLAYHIYGPAPSNGSWSDVTPVVIPLSRLASNDTFTLNVQAVVLGAQQRKEPASYSQTLTATASYGNVNCTTGPANTSSLTFHVSATVAKSCNVSASNLSFGAVGNLKTPVDGQSTVTLVCSNGIGYGIGLNGGLTGASGSTARKMMSGSQSILYGLYQNSARTIPWTSAALIAGTGSAAPQSIPVFGRVPAQPTPLIGTYSDTIVVSVTY